MRYFTSYPRYNTEQHPAPPFHPSLLLLYCPPFPTSVNSSGNNAPTFDELWIYFQAILIRIFGEQDGTTAPPGGSTSTYPGVVVEHSWMFTV